jgi:RNA polymerase sigma-70 factor (ECF subfamily)
MADKKFLAGRFEASRGHLRGVAYRMLGSRSEAEDAVQEAWLRLAGSETAAVQNLDGWLTTVVARICLDMLRARKVRHEEPIGPEAEAVAGSDDTGSDAEIADSIGLAMLVVLETLPPAERVAFVLHDMFNLPFDDIAPVVGRSPVAARQLASRGRRRVQGGAASSEAEVDRTRQREVVSAFLAAARGDDFAALLAVLDPDVVLRADATAVAASIARASAGAPRLAPEIRGAAAVANTFKGRAAEAQLALIEDEAGLAWVPGGRPVVVFEFAVEDGRIVEIDLTMNAKSVAALQVSLASQGSGLDP